MVDPEFSEVTGKVQFATLSGSVADRFVCVVEELIYVPRVRCFIIQRYFILAFVLIGNPEFLNFIHVVI